MSIDLELGEHQLRVRDAARELAAEVLGPAARRFEDEEHIPPHVFEALAARGLMGVNVSPARGGAGAGVVAYSVAMTEIARACASTAVTMAVTNMVSEVIERFGDAAQQARFVPAMQRGEVGGFALSEVGAGSDPGGMLTTARRDGTGWILEGTKQWISHGDHSCVLVVWARTGGDGASGISCFLVPGGAPGLSVSKLEDKMGLRASHTAALVLEGVRVPADALLGEVGGGFRIAMMALDGGRIGIASQALGIGEAAFDHAAAVLRGRGPSAREAQGACFRLADMRTELDAARLLTLRAASLKERGAPFTREASMAKLFATEATARAIDAAIEIAGDEGCEGTLSRLLRDARVTRIYEGTSEVQRIVIGRDVLRSV